jgi:hypothetical protein
MLDVVCLNEYFSPEAHKSSASFGKNRSRLVDFLFCRKPIDCWWFENRNISHQKNRTNCRINYKPDAHAYLSHYEINKFYFKK